MAVYSNMYSAAFAAKTNMMKQKKTLMLKCRPREVFYLWAIEHVYTRLGRFVQMVNSAICLLYDHPNNK